MRELRLSALLIAAVCQAVLAQMPSISGVVDAARFGTRVAPGSLATIFGTNFGTVPRELTVLVGGRPAYVLQVGNTYAHVQLPVDLPTGAAAVTAERLSQRSLPFPITLSPHAPGLFVKNSVIFSNNPNAIGEGTFTGTDGKMIDQERLASPGESVAVFAAGLGATSPIVPTGTVAPADPLATTATQPRITVSGKPATVMFSVLVPGQIGLYQVVFQLPVGLEQGTHQVKLEIAGVESNTVTIPVGKPTPQINTIVNAATPVAYNMVAPGSIVTLWGANLGAAFKLGLYPATEYDGVSVSFGGIAAPLFALAAAQGQVNLLAPTELPESGEVIVQVRFGASTSPVARLRMTPAQPGIFRLPDPSNAARRTGAALFAGTAWRVMPSSQARAYGWPDNCSGLAAVADCGQPAAPGDNVQIYATGLGRATPGGDPSGRVLPTGSVAPADGNPLYLTVRKPTVMVGGVAALVQFSGLAPGYAGLYQVNIQIPAGAPSGDDVSVTLTLPGAPGDGVTLAIRR